MQAQREADRDDGREAFRDRGDREADRREEQELDVSWVPEDADAEDQARRGKDGDPDLTPEAVELLLERRLLLRLLLDEAGDLAEFRRHPGLDDDRLPAASFDRGPHEHHVLPIADERVPRQRLDRLADRLRFPRERGLIEAESGGLEETRVRRDTVSRGQDRDVAGHEFAGRDGHDPSLAEHMSLRSGEALEGLQGPLRAVLLDEAEDRVHDHDRHDQDRVIEVREFPLQGAEDGRNDCRDDEDDHEDIDELGEQDPPWADPSRPHELVRTESGQPTGGVARVEARGRGVESPEDIVGRQGVPLVGHRAPNRRTRNKGRPGHPSNPPDPTSRSALTTPICTTNGDATHWDGNLGSRADASSDRARRGPGPGSESS